MKDPDKTQRANAKIRAEAYADARTLTYEERETACRIIAKVCKRRGIHTDNIDRFSAFRLLAKEAQKWQ